MTTSAQPASGLSAQLIAELNAETRVTRRVLERVPEHRLAWAPHPTSRSLGTLAMHVAVVPGAIADLVSVPVRQVPGFPDPVPASLAEILGALDESVARATDRLSGWGDGDLLAEWKMVHGETTIMAMPRIAMLRAVMLNHWYHHRGQLTVYLRMLDVPVPSVYGPSADENPLA